jgi:hypothetical protein
MQLPDNAVIVHDLAGASARLEMTQGGPSGELAALGFQMEDGRHVRPIRHEQDRRTLAHALVGLGALFSVGPGWTPSDLLEYYRTQGEEIGTFKSISWTGPNAFLIETR